MVLLLLLLFIIGACLGSFTNVLIDRLPRGKSIFFGRSKCEKCRKQIKSFDLIPLLSYLVLRGKCRYCHKKIPFRVFLVELFSGFLFTAVYFLLFTNWLTYFLLCAITLILLAIAIIDIDHGIIFDPLLLVLGALSVFYILLTSPNSFFFHILSGLIAFVFFLIIFLITRGRGIGFGDVKYAFFIGFLLTFPQLIISFYASFLTGAVISIILVITGKKKMRGGTIPFGPFLSLGMFVSLLYGNQIVAIALPLLGMR